MIGSKSFKKVSLSAFAASIAEDELGYRVGVVITDKGYNQFRKVKDSMPNFNDAIIRGKGGKISYTLTGKIPARNVKQALDAMEEILRKFKIQTVEAISEDNAFVYNLKTKKVELEPSTQSDEDLEPIDTIKDELVSKEDTSTFAVPKIDLKLSKHIADYCTSLDGLELQRLRKALLNRQRTNYDGTWQADYFYGKLKAEAKRDSELLGEHFAKLSVPGLRPTELDVITVITDGLDMAKYFKGKHSNIFNDAEKVEEQKEEIPSELKYLEDFQRVLYDENFRTSSNINCKDSLKDLTTEQLQAYYKLSCNAIELENSIYKINRIAKELLENRVLLGSKWSVGSNPMINSKQASNVVAEAIIKQLGGINRLSAMLGANNFIGHKDGVSFKFKGSTKMNYVKISVNSKDLYDLDFKKLVGMNSKDIATEKNINVEILRKTFTQITGLDLSI